MRPADQLDEPASHRVLESRRTHKATQPVVAVLVPPSPGARGRMAGCESRRRVSVHPATAEVGAQRVASARTGVQPGRLGAARAEDLLDLPLDLLEVHELPVDGGEADVRDFVQVAQTLHDHLADFAAWDLHAAGAAELGLYVVDDGAQALRGDVALFGGFL